MFAKNKNRTKNETNTKNKNKIKANCENIGGNSIEEINNSFYFKKENLVDKEMSNGLVDKNRDNRELDKDIGNVLVDKDIDNELIGGDFNNDFNSFNSSELDNSDDFLIPKYEIQKFNFSNDEKILLNELRTNLINLAVSDNDIQLNNKLLLEDIFQFLKKRFNSYNLANDIPNDDNDNFENLNDDDFNIFNNNVIGDYGGINENNNENIGNIGDNYELNESYLFDLAKKFLQELIGFGKLDYLINDDKLEEIMIIGVNKPVFVYHREFGMMETNLIFSEESEITQIIELMARESNRRIDQESPILDARLFDGSRVNATISPVSADGPSITIRKFKKDPFTIIDLIKFNTLNSEIAAFLWLALDGLGVKPANFIVSGGTSSGKTTMLNALSAFINPKERIITIEDTLELQIPHKHLLRMEARSVNIENQGEITIEDLVKNSLRQRPDRIIVGEVRGKEAITLFTALNTGHSGFGTLHANNSRETITRLTNAPMSVPKIMISAIDFIIMEKRIYKSDGFSFRRITEIDEVVGVEEGTIQLNKLFKWNGEKDKFENLAIVSDTLEGIANLKGLSINYLKNEIANRKKLLDYLVKKNISNTNQLAKFIEKYYINSEKLFLDLGISM